MTGPTRAVLLVEDDDAIADMLRGFFERDGYRFLHALTGEEAVERLRTRPVSAILLDINLPGMDGVETCRRIREFSRTPLIMLTARDDEVDKVLGLEMGAGRLRHEAVLSSRVDGQGEGSAASGRGAAG